jgi:hypothetical protein
LNLWESDHIFFPWIEAGKFFSAKFEYDEDVMGRHDVVFYDNPTLGLPWSFIYKTLSFY